MLTNLFSMFDPLMYSYSPFLYMLLLFFYLKLNAKTSWFSLNSKKVLNFTLTSFLSKEFKKELDSLVSEKNKTMGIKKMIFSILIVIFSLNFLSLFPFIMSTSSHMSLNLSMALILWATSIMMALKISWTNFLSHLTPMGTPIALMSFMVLIETVSSIIRPLTLAVRLMANMVAGHLLLVLLSNFNMLSSLTFYFSSPVMFILTILEMMVSFIQAYVFTLLLILYFKEAY